MILEVADIDVTPGSEADFVAAYLSVRPVILSAVGCHSARLTRGIESHSRFVLLVEWDSVDAHEKNFRGTDLFARWRAAVGPFFAHPPRVEHFDVV